MAIVAWLLLTSVVWRASLHRCRAASSADVPADCQPQPQVGVGRKIKRGGGEGEWAEVKASRAKCLSALEQPGVLDPLPLPSTSVLLKLLYIRSLLTACCGTQALSNIAHYFNGRKQTPHSAGVLPTKLHYASFVSKNTPVLIILNHKTGLQHRPESHSR